MTVPTDATPLTAPLQDIRVIDMSMTTPGAYASVFLADAGAEVVLIEPPTGSPLRKLTGWPAMSRGKKSIALDLQDDAGRERLRVLLRSADVLITSSRPAALERLGLTPDALNELNPRLVSASIPPGAPPGPGRTTRGTKGSYSHGWVSSMARPG